MLQTVNNHCVAELQYSEISHTISETLFPLIMKNTAATKCDFAVRGPVGTQPEYDGETTFKMCQRPPLSSIPVAEVIFDICVIKLSRYQKPELERML